MSPSLRPERSLLHPVWLAALVLLVANDHLLKGSGLLHHVLTGKLSDVAGMVVAPALLAAIVRARSRRGVAACHVAIGLGFAAIQISPGAAELLVAAMDRLHIHWRIWPDLTDLLALPGLGLSWQVLVPAMAEPRPLGARLAHMLRALAAAAGLMACLGTSSVPPEAPAGRHAEPTPQPLAVERSTASPLGLAALEGAPWRADAEHDWHRAYRFEAGRYTASGHPTWEESGRIELLEANGQRLRVRFTERVYDGKRDDDLETWIELSADGGSFVMDGVRYVKQPHAATLAAEAATVAEQPH